MRQPQDLMEEGDHNYEKSHHIAFNPSAALSCFSSLNMSQTVQSVIACRQEMHGGTCLSFESREEVDAMVRKAVAAGGTTYSEAKDYGFMWQHGFQDLDGHIWELIYMEPSALKQG